MQLFPYKLIRQNSLVNLEQQLKTFEKDVFTATGFVQQIAQGNLDVALPVTAEQSELTASLDRMRNEMRNFAQQEKQRNWTTEGLAKFVDILRSNNQNIEALADVIISTLVKYIRASQGALYIINDDQAGDPFLEMIACYAYNKKKHLHQRLELGHGITGQVALEKETAYFTDIPKDFVRITSGLGEALPRNLLVVPLKQQDTVYGIVEIASFTTIERYRIEFVEKLGESIAAAMNAVKVAERTKRLLTETQMQAEQMRAQEEEMRQNMEELAATQEEMLRAQKRTEDAFRQVRDKEVYLNNMLNATADAILTVDQDLNVVLANETMIKTFRTQGIMIDVGFHITKLAPKGSEEEFIVPYKRAFAGEVVETTRTYFDHHYLINYNPLRNQKGEIVGVSLFTKDVTQQVSLQRETEKLLVQSKQQEEELRAQEEELRQNMEEISATQEEITKQMIELDRVKHELEIREEVFGLTTILSESDVYGTITYANSKLCEVSGYSHDELIGKPHNVFRHPDMPKELFGLFWKTIKDGRVFKGIVKNKTKNGQYYWVDATIVPVKNEHGQIVKYIGARYHIQDDELATLLYNRQARKYHWPELQLEVELTKAI